MPSAVHAGSLADVIDLAGNPPQNLGDRSLPDVQQPLVLYIARVPGSKDVFLTTMKPQQKVVTAQDVKSSLYYLHVASPDDYELLQIHDSDEEPAEDYHDTRPISSDNPNISRKPVPRNLNLDPSKRPSLPYGASPRPQALVKGSNRNIQALIEPDRGSRPGQRSLDSTPMFPPRKLLGPRSMNPRLHSVDDSALQNVPGRENIDTRRWSEQPATKAPQLPPRPMHIHDGNIYKGPVNTGNIALPTRHYWEWEKSWEAERVSEARAEMAEITAGWRDSQETLRDASGSTQDASLSLIRRYNGEQWNVAKIDCIGQEHSIKAASYLGSGMMIEILTPGYSKFVTTNDPNVRTPSLGTPTQVNSQNEEGKLTFRRHLQLYKNAKAPTNHDIADWSEAGFATDQVRPNLESERQSFDSFGGSAMEQSGQKQTSSRKYVIESPWKGVCEFSTGIAGRSLKCKHAYTSTDRGFGPGTFSVTVSELRFNLPSSKALGTRAAKTPNPGTPRGGKRSSLFLRSHQRRTSSFETDQVDDNGYIGAKDELEDRLDLSLGQEHAGGGFGGKQAKLGKLIVEAEGLQMLDLVVAANMALWWKVYERIT